MIKKIKNKWRNKKDDKINNLQSIHGKLKIRMCIDAQFLSHNILPSM